MIIIKQTPIIDTIKLCKEKNVKKFDKTNNTLNIQMFSSHQTSEIYIAKAKGRLYCPITD